MRISVKILDRVCLAGLVLLALAGGFAVVKLAGARVRSVASRQASLEARVEELREARAALATFEEALQSNQSALDALRTRLPQSQGMGDFLTGLDQMARQNKLELKTVQPGNAVREEWCSRSPVRFVCRGSFVGLHAFLFQLESLDRFVRIDTLSISRPALTAPCDMDVSCSVYGR